MIFTNRTKSWDPEVINNGTVLDRIVNANGSINFFSSSSNQPQKKVVRYMSGQNIDNFRARKARGELLPYTHYERTDETWFSSTLKFGWTNIYDQVGTHTQTGGGTPGSIKASAIAYAGSFDPDRFLHKAAEQLTAHWDSLTFAAETGSLIRSYFAYSKRMLSLRDPATLGDIWLDARYHWRPLIYDFFNLRDAAIQLLKQRERFTHSAGTTFDRTQETYSEFSDAGTILRDTITTTYKIGLRGSITCDYERPSFQFNPIVTTWELVPYSFLMDQIIDIGGLLRTLLFLNNVRALSSAVGYKISAEQVGIRRVKSVGSNHKSYTVTDPNLGKIICEITLRTPSNINPTLQSGLLGNVYHLVDVLALAVRFITAKKNREPDARNLAYGP